MWPNRFGPKSGPFEFCRKSAVQSSLDHQSRHLQPIYGNDSGERESQASLPLNFLVLIIPHLKHWSVVVFVFPSRPLLMLISKCLPPQEQNTV
jgi:hypothetical protein